MTCVAPAMIVGAPFQGPMPDNRMMYPSSVSFVPVMAPPMNMDAMMGMCMMQRGPTPAPTPNVKASARDTGRHVAASDKTKPVAKKSRGREEQRSAKASGGGRSAEPAVDEESVGKGVISLLQEFVQCSKQFPSPQHRPILQWSFDTHMADFTTLEFRAQVAFLLDGVPHHVAGSWQPSKKLAQRDTAERCLGFFVGSWGAYLLQQGDSDAGQVAPAGISPRDAVRQLDAFCRSFAACGGEGPSWSVAWEEGRCSAVAELSMLGVRHKFAGATKRTEDEAKADTAKRVLWYLQCPGFENLFEPDPQSIAVVAKEIPMPPANWASASEDGESVQAAERKTALMRVQNRLQQMFARQLRPGQSVWEWSYETDPDDSAWPPLCRASVQIPAAGRNFEGPWVRGQREAQIEACHLVSAFLSTGSTRSTTSGESFSSEGSSQNQQPELRGALEPGKVKTGADFTASMPKRSAVGGC
eukprot:gb/GFBE01020679.1/.p1 GENE.gb/GFBE01020679.1/~~gb/GFBE01020679.1/.p1  ORF type:complete len:471 (+),score=85.53 gb/GFBE01020679.1/:1-1413(+)